MVTKKKTTKRKTKKNTPRFNFNLYLILGLCSLALIATLLGIKLSITPAGEIVYEPYFIESESTIPAVIENDQGELIELDEIPVMEEVDGGQFKDKDTGLSLTDAEYQDLGWSETYNVSSPEAFKNDTLNRCIIANNYYGAQCVSLARVYWWSYADRDVSTCGTGAAKGMMNCADENAGNDFLIFWADQKNQIQAGDWLVFTGGQYGHVGMALGPVVNGYVALLGENQGGRYCEGGGAATNIININIKNLIGFYRPKAYEQKQEPAEEPKTPVNDDCKIRSIQYGDTLGAIMYECEGQILWGEYMNEYARHWFSLDFVPNQSVYTGWTTGTGVGLFAGDRIEYRD